MSTRSEIEIRNGDYVLHLYHHCDGYFEGVGKELVDILNNTKKKNGEWPAAVDYAVEVLKDNQYEITMCPHWDIEYYYVVDFNKKTIVGHPVKQIPCDKVERLAGLDMIAMFT